MKKVFINIAEESYGIKVPSSYVEAYRDLHENYNILSYTFYIGTEENYENYEFHRWVCSKDQKDMFDKIQKLSLNKEIIFINTFTEQLIDLCNNIKKDLWEKTTLHSDSFRDKSLQRKLLQNFDSNLWIKFLNYGFEEIEQNKIIDFLWFPFIVKPSSWIQSAGVAIIHSEDELSKYLLEYESFLEKFEARGFSNNSLVFEEFLDGEMFSIDYFVDKFWKITLTPPVEVKIWTDIWIQDFMNYVRSFRSSAIDKIDTLYLQNFIESSVNALGIKNTFVHHEFKLTWKWKFKTIEINGRIGWFRLEMIEQALNFNWLSAVVWNTPNNDLENNFASFLIYPEKKCILQWFNEKLFNKINEIKSIYSINKILKFIWKEIWLTSQWFTKIAVIKIKNSNADQFERDFNLIEENYRKLLITKK